MESLLAEDDGVKSFLEAPVPELRPKMSGEHSGQSTIGRQLGSYHVLSLLGHGGMGEVYCAHDTKLGRDVALKILPAAFARDPERLARFRREARLLAALNHPNIAAIYGTEEFDGLHCLVMELVPGETLAGPLPLEKALTICHQLARGLEEAHRKNITHRDIKPANIKVTPDGVAKILDFGLAKALGWEQPGMDLSESRPASEVATQEGRILGTPAYMSPEQIRGKPVDKQTDIWAFGCVLYEMLTGRVAFGGETVSDTVATVLEREPDWHVLPDRTPSNIRTLLLRCLQRDPKRRLQDIGDARIEIEEMIAHPVNDVVEAEANAGLAPRRGRERFAWGTAVALIALIAALLAFRQFREVPPIALPEMRVDITTPPTQDPFSFAISPDGLQLTFVAAGDGQPRLWLRPLDAATAEPLGGTEGASYPFWSPDSRSIGFFADGKLKRIDVSGGLPQTLAAAPGGRGGSWSSDGTILFAPNATAPLNSVRSSGGEALAVTKLDPPRQSSHRSPHFLPDGRHFLFFILGPPETQGIYLGALDSPETKRLTIADTAGTYMPPGWLLFVRQGTLVARRLDISRGELAGDPVTVADPVGFDASLFIGAFSVSTTGLVTYRSSGAGRRQLAWFDRAGNVLVSLSAPDETGLVAPELSPDGKRAVAHRTVQSNTDIWIFDSARTARFTFDLSLDRFPVWSPDGNRIVFDSNRKGHRDLYQKRSDSAGAEELLLESSEDKVAHDWSPDGRFLLYLTLNAQTGFDLWILPLEGTRKPFVFLKTPFDESGGQFSPDGHRVAYQSNESGRFEIYVRPFPGPGGQWQVSASGGIQPRWGPNGKELYYIAPDGKLMAVPIAVKGAAIEPGTPSTLFQTHIWGGGTNARQRLQYDVAPDGGFLINTVLDEAAPPITLIQNWKPR